MRKKVEMYSKVNQGDKPLGSMFVKIIMLDLKVKNLLWFNTPCSKPRNEGKTGNHQCCMSSTIISHHHQVRIGETEKKKERYINVF